MRASLRTGLIAGAAALTVLTTTTAAGAATTAAPRSPQGYVQRCTDLGNGDLCIDVTGSVGQTGRIGVGYWKHAGDVVHVRLGWQNTTGGGPNSSQTVHGPLFAGDNTGTDVWTTYLAAGCVYPLIDVIGQYTLKGKEVCVPA
ncbi:hypothetical protein GTY54_32105 [Streptomyces sp. SID625]|nr:hypothetical protein [Streptomyces sp. SID625]